MEDSTSAPQLTVQQVSMASKFSDIMAYVLVVFLMFCKLASVNSNLLMFSLFYAIPKTKVTGQ